MNERNILFVQYGCGLSTGKDWENFDSSPTLRIERLPLVGPRLSALLSGNGARFPQAVKYGDIVAGLPVRDGSALGCYASHVLEHLSLEDCRTALANTYRLLAEGGVFRLIVPDLRARAERYLAEAGTGSPHAAATFLRNSCLGRERRAKDVFQTLRLLMGNSEHLWMWDEHAMTAELQRAGFVDIRRCRFGDSELSAFAQVEDRTRFVDESVGVEECALEARKPRSASLCEGDGNVARPGIPREPAGDVASLA